jgi:hypothetical protein
LSDSRGYLNKAGLIREQLLTLKSDNFYPICLANILFFFCQGKFCNNNVISQYDIYMTFVTILILLAWYNLTMTTSSLSPLGFVAPLYNERHDVGSRMGYVYGATVEEVRTKISEEFENSDSCFGVNMAGPTVPIEDLEGFDWSTLPVEVCLWL